MKSTTRAKLPILHTEGMKEWERWLTGHHESSPGVWLMIAKKGSALTSVSYAEAPRGKRVFVSVIGVRTTPGPDRNGLTARTAGRGLS